MKHLISALLAVSVAAFVAAGSSSPALAVGEAPGASPGASSDAGNSPSSDSSSQGMSPGDNGERRNSTTRRNNTAVTQPTIRCPNGMVWDPDAKGFLFFKGACVKAADAGKNKSDRQGLIYDYGKALAKAGAFEEAIAALKAAPDQGDPRVLNYLGYSHRKLGRMDEALRYYHAAVAMDPDFSLVREYLGEAYIQLGLLEKAREQLSEIERICGSKSCGEYGLLADLIVGNQLGQ